ncbi:MAG TPA: hypothetical protein VGB14_16305 [Acidimicrobiales bacterium]|jgi:hypothetical protein
MVDTKLADACDDLLAAAVDALGDRAPTGAYVEAGPLVADPAPGCDQLIVFPVSVGLTPIGSGQACVIVPRARLGVRLTLGCGPTAQQPTDEQRSEFARRVNEDGWTLWKGIAARRRGTPNPLFPRVTTEPNDIDLADLVPHGPQGAASGWRFDVTVTIR